MIRISISGLAVCIAVTLATSNVAAAQQTFERDSSKQPPSPTVAVVNDQEISLDVVHRFLDRSFSNLPELADRADRDATVIATGVQYCVNREVILQHLQSAKFKTGESEIDRQVEELEARLQLTGLSLQQFLDDTQLTESEFRRELLWQTSWRKYVKKFVTTQHLEKQFALKRKYFDGTKLHVAQILWKDKSPETLSKAKEIKAQLESGTLEWNAAVEKHSESASAKNHGNLGWIEYSGPMPRDFTQQAFALKKGDYSDPLTSRYGIHLIKCIEIENGTKTFADVAGELREIETNRLFQLVADRHRSNATIEVRDLNTASKK